MTTSTFTGSPRTRRGRQRLFTAVLLPLWASYIARVYACIVILQKDGTLSWFLPLEVPLVDCAVSARRRSCTAAVAGWRRWHDLTGEGAPSRDNYQLPIAGAHCEGTGVSLLKNAQDVGDHLAAISCGPTPPNHDPLADIGGGDPDR